MSQELKPCESCAAPKHQQYPQRNGDSICAACGATYGLATAPVSPAGEWEKLAKHLAYYLPSALVSHQHMMTPETLSDALETLHKVRNMPALPAGGEVERYQAVALFTEEGSKMNYDSPGPWMVKASDHDAHVTRLQAENAALQQRLNLADQRVDELQSELAKARELLSRAERVLYEKGIWGAAQEIESYLAHRSAPAAKGGA